MCLALSRTVRRALARRLGFCLFRLWRGCADVRAGFVGVLGEVVVEHVHQFVGLCGVGGFVLPALFGAEDVIRYAAAFGMMAKPKRGSVSLGALASSPLLMASSMAREYLSLMRS